MKFSICNEIFQGWDLEKTFRFVKECGYDALELAPFTVAPDVTTISPATRSQIVTWSEQAKLPVCAIHWVLVQTDGMYVTHPDPEVRRKTGRYFCDLIDFCSDIGASKIVVGSPKQRNVLPGTTSAQAWEYGLDTFSLCLERARQKGVVLCLEPLSPAETNFINTAGEAIRFVQTFNSDFFKIILDVKAMSSEAVSIPEIIHRSWPHFAHFHANDKNLKGPGFGDVDFRPILGALDEAGYQDVVSVEVFNFDEGPERIARESLSCLKKSMPIQLKKS